MTLPAFNTLTSETIFIDLSRPAIAIVLNAIETREPLPLQPEVLCEVENFANLLHNLLDRSAPRNLDLVGG